MHPPGELKSYASNQIRLFLFTQKKIQKINKFIMDFLIVCEKNDIKKPLYLQWLQNYTMHQDVGKKNINQSMNMTESGPVLCTLNVTHNSLFCFITALSQPDTPKSYRLRYGKKRHFFNYFDISHLRRARKIPKKF